MSNQPTENKALATIDPAVMQHKKFLDTRQDALSKWIVGGVRPEALIRFALHDLSTNEKLRACTPQSIYLGLLACAVTGLEPGSLKGEAYLVPFKDRAQFIPGWKGIVKQARRSQAVKTITANIVCQRDVFDIDLGTANRIIHKPALTNRGEVIGAYAWAQMSSGEFEHEWLDMEDLNAIRSFAESRGKSPAWTDWPDQMQRKSALRRLGKRLPLGEDYYRGLAIGHAVGQGGSVREQLDIITDGDASATGGSEGTPISQFTAPPPVAAAPQGPPPGAPATETPRRGRPPKDKPIEVTATERPTTTGPGDSPPTTRPDLGEPAGGSATKFNAAVETARAADAARTATDQWGQSIAVDPTAPNPSAQPVATSSASVPAASSQISQTTAPSAGADDGGFGEDPVDTAPAGSMPLLGPGGGDWRKEFVADLAAGADRRQVEEKGKVWMAWARKRREAGDATFGQGGENSGWMAKTYATRKTEVPA